MLSSIKNHPFAVEAFFERSVVLTFALQKEELIGFLPECFVLDTFDDKWAFLAVAFVQTKGLRPRGFPKIFSNDFILTGYRIFVRYKSITGKNLRGLYILKSETNNRKMELTSKLFTHYNFSTTDITQISDGDDLKIASSKSNFLIHINTNSNIAALPSKSPFSNYKDARRFVGPLPFTFTYLADRKQVLIVEGVRENWIAKPVNVIEYDVPFFKLNGLEGQILANAFMIDNTPYYWKKGRLENWNK